MKTRERRGLTHVRIGNVTVLTTVGDDKVQTSRESPRKRNALRQAAGVLVKPLKLVEK